MRASGKWASLTIIAICQVAAMALWFSATAVVPALTAEFGLSGFLQASFTSAVQAGFVVGSLTSAVLNLADRIEPRRFFSVTALVAAAANAGILVVPPDSLAVVALRFFTGMCMAGIYPVGMKLAAGWAKGDMGLLVGLLVGALTLGSASPHLFNALGGIDWRFTLGSASVSALFAGLAIHLVAKGPGTAATPRFRPDAVLAAWRDRPLRLANLGYLGHMWELYAMWAWIAVFLQASFALRLPSESALPAAKLAAFAVIASGAIGCLAGGWLADRIGRTYLTMGAMALSGSCALLAGFLFGGPPWLLLALCLVWGIAVIADSAQFSAAIAELSEPQLIGTMLTLQTSLGFTLTLVTIHLMPYAVGWFGWHYAFAVLAIGPWLGVWAMARLRLQPEATRIAGGRR